MSLVLITACAEDREPVLDGSVVADGPPAVDRGGGLPDGYGPLWPCTAVGQACNAHDPCAINPTCGPDKLCHPASVQDCGDSLSCTTDTCKGMGMCENLPASGSCALPVKAGAGADGGVGADAGAAGPTEIRCFSKGDRDPADPCRVCDPDQNATKWSPASGGACDDNSTCTKDDYCQGGVCKGTYYGSQCADNFGCTDDLCDGKGGCLGNPLKSDWCLINGVCHADKANDPAGTCNTCDVTQSQSAWTPITNTCTIGGKCYKPGDKDPTGCSECDPSSSTTSWTPLSGLCLIGGKCYTSGASHSGGCATCAPATSSTSWTVTGSYCLIADVCHSPKDKDSTGCAECDPGADKYGWTPLTGMCQIKGTCYASGATHPAGCGECKPATSATHWTLLGSATGCLIDDACYASGATLGCYTCAPSTSQTAWTQITGCNQVEGLATASSSGGGASTTHGPTLMNDGKLQADCLFHWVSAGSTPGTAWIQYDWPGAVVVGSISFDTTPAATAACSSSSGRSLAGGTLQHWNGASWVDIGTISGKTDDWSYSFTQITTTKLRLYGVHATDTAGQMSNPVIFEWQVFGK